MTNKFIPAEDYALLLKQAYALNTLRLSQERRLIMMDKKISELETKLKEFNTETINSERRANEILTNELERLKRGEFICKKCGVRNDAEKPEGLPEF